MGANLALWKSDGIDESLHLGELERSQTEAIPDVLDHLIVFR